MKCSIEETKQILESYYQDTEPETTFQYMFEDLIEIVINQLSLSRVKAIVFIHNWFDNRH